MLFRKLLIAGDLECFVAKFFFAEIEHYFKIIVLIYIELYDILVDR